MSKTFNALCTELNINPEQGDSKALGVLAQWCHDNISTDIVYQEGDTTKKYKQYVNLTRQYLDEFLTTIPQNIDEQILKFKNMNALQYAAIQGYDYYLRSLLLDSDKWNISNTAGMTLLHLAAAKGHIHTVETLLEKGANPTLLNNNLQPPIFSALFIPISHEKDIMKKKEAIFNTLKKSAPETVLLQDKNGETIMHLIAIYGFSKLLPSLLEKHGELAFRADTNNEYPIHKAILNQQTLVADLLLKKEDIASLIDSAGRNLLL